MTIQTENKTPESVTPAIEVTAPATKKDVQTKLVKAVAKTTVNKVANKKTALAKTIEAKPTKTKAVPSAAPKTQASPSPKPPKEKLESALKKPEKIKMERDSFTIPKEEYAQIANLKKRLEVLGKPAKKSELLRAGLKLLANMDDTMLQASMAAIPTIKTGRPKM